MVSMTSSVMSRTQRQRGLHGTCSHMGRQPRFHLGDFGGRCNHSREDFGERMWQMVFAVLGGRQAWNTAESGGVTTFEERASQPTGRTGNFADMPASETVGSTRPAPRKK